MEERDKYYIWVPVCLGCLVFAILFVEFVSKAAAGSGIP